MNDPSVPAQRGPLYATRVCEVEGCGRPYSCKGMCAKHYLREWNRDRRGYTAPEAVLDLPGEQWRPVAGHEDGYEVSNLARVRSLTRTVVRSNGDPQIREGQLLTNAVHPATGRLTVTLTNGERKLVQRVVLEAFVGPCPPDMEACHGPDHDPKNCRLDNLRWDTHSANMLDRLENGTDVYRNRECCPRGHKLVLPNLVACNWAKGYRDCLACARARATVQYANRRGLKCDFVEAAREHYVKIMNLNPSRAE